MYYKFQEFGNQLIWVSKVVVPIDPVEDSKDDGNGRVYHLSYENCLR